MMTDWDLLTQFADRDQALRQSSSSLQGCDDMFPVTLSTVQR